MTSTTGYQEPDRISSGPEREPRWAARDAAGTSRLGRLRRRWARWRWSTAALTAVAVAAVGGWLLYQAGQGPGRPVADPFGSVTAAGPAQTYVQVAEICPPVTDGLHALVVSFILRNVSSVPVAVRSVQPQLPLGGLDVVSTDVSGGTCAATTGAPAGLDLPAGGELVVAFRFLLPGTCPQALPIQARTVVLVGPASSVNAEGAPGVSVVQGDLGVFNDLGSIRFSDCPAPAS